MLGQVTIPMHVAMAAAPAAAALFLRAFRRRSPAAPPTEEDPSTPKQEQQDKRLRKSRSHAGLRNLACRETLEGSGQLVIEKAVVVMVG